MNDLNEEAFLYIREHLIGPVYTLDEVDWRDLVTTSTIQTSDLHLGNKWAFHKSNPPESPDSPEGRITWVMI